MTMFEIAAMNAADWYEVKTIYQAGLETRNATFQTMVPSFSEWDSNHHSHSRLVAKKEGVVLGWCALMPTSSRHVYTGVAEISIYVALNQQGQGVGGLLMQALINESEKNEIWTISASIFPENKASIHLHQKYGFDVVGRRSKIAQLDGMWRDTVLLERRSNLEQFQ